MDYEGELVAVLGRGGRNIGREVEIDSVAGCSLFNDGSVREFQFKAPQWTVGKNSDGTGAFLSRVRDGRRPSVGVSRLAGRNAARGFFGLILIIAASGEEVCAFGWREGADEAVECGSDSVEGAGGGAAEESL